MSASTGRLRPLPRLHGAVRGLRICTLDIETRPILGHVWGLFDQRLGLNQVVEHGDIMSVGFKFLGEPVQHVAEWDEGGYDAMVKTVFNVIDEADILVTYNGKSFDEKKLNWAFARAGFDRPAPYKSIDLIRVVRRQFAPDSKKLDHVASELGLGNKLATGGMDLWTKAMAGDVKSQAKMERYCKQDVVLTEKLYLRLLPWLPDTVNLPALAGVGYGCPTCGSPKVRNAPKALAAAASTYALLKCGNCGSWAKGPQASAATQLRAA